MCMSIIGEEGKMLEFTHKQRQGIVKALSECEADVEAVLEKLEKLELYDCALSLRDVAKVLRLSKTKIYQIEQRALHKLRKELDKSV